MIIQQLTLDSYRGANYLSLGLDQQLNVLYGVNGTGKSTVLDSLAIALSWLVNRLSRAGASGRHIAELDITNGQFSSMIHIAAEENGRPISWQLVKNRKGVKAGSVKSDFSGLKEFLEQTQEEVTRSEQQTNLPLLVYYPVNRAVLDIPLRIRSKHTFDIFAAFEGALTSGANFRTFFEWFREREDLENENRKYANGSAQPDGYQFPDPQLEAVRSALATFLPEFSNFSIRRNPLRMEVSKNNKIFRVDQLSDGEKCLIALVGDLARRMAIANPVGNTPLQGKGIVLIDEIDLHLHPRWQRMIVPKLMEVFPHCQFIISTHSPHVLTQVQPQSLFMLEQGEDGLTSTQPTESYGKNVDRILEDLMGLATTRPDNVTADLRKIFLEIQQGNVDAARQQVARLKEQIGDDPELVKAGVLIKRKEIIGK